MKVLPTGCHTCGAIQETVNVLITERLLPALSITTENEKLGKSVLPLSCGL